MLVEFESRACASARGFFVRRRDACRLSPASREGMERRAAPLKSTPCGAARLERRARASRRSIAAILHPGAVLPGADGAILAALVPAAFAPVRPSRVQQSKADPRSWVGRLPEASGLCVQGTKRGRSILCAAAGEPYPQWTERLNNLCTDAEAADGRAESP